MFRFSNAFSSYSIYKLPDYPNVWKELVMVARLLRNVASSGTLGLAVSSDIGAATAGTAGKVFRTNF